VTDGFLVLDKPTGLTSHDTVARCRRIFSLKRVGHAGTLDPDATGVLLVGLGRATRLLQFLSGLPKRYTGEVVLGIATSTLDSSGTATGTWDMGHVTLEMARKAAAGLTGDSLQMPPMVSAIKVGGRRLHELARQGIDVERRPRPISVTRFDVAAAPLVPDATPGYGPVLTIDVECSSGTYVRSLAADLGTALGGGAHLRALRRQRVGPFSLAEAVTLEHLEQFPTALPPLEAVRSMQHVVVGTDLESAVAVGKVLPIELVGTEGGAGGGPWALVSGEGELLAVYQAHKPGQMKPIVVLNSS
jgi:tRNA pseudouridine55 synthase